MYGNVVLCELSNGIQPSRRRCAGWLKHFCQCLIQAVQADGGFAKIHCGEFAQQIDVPRDQRILADQRDGLSRFQSNLKALASDLQYSFDRLIAVGYSRHHDRFACVRRTRQPVAKKPRSVSLDENRRLKVQPGAQSEVLVRRSGVAVAAAVQAASIRIQAVAERNVGAVVF